MPTIDVIDFKYLHVIDNGKLCPILGNYMTDKHFYRANGESFFSIDDLINIKAIIEFSERKSQGRVMAIDYMDLMRKVDKEIKYIEETE